MSNLCFLEAKMRLAKFVGEGYCHTHPEVGIKVNQAQQDLLREGDWRNTLRVVRFCTFENCFALPREIETVIKVNVCKYPGDVWTKYYQFLEGGPGTLDYSKGILCGTDLVDAGWHPTQFPFTYDERKIIAFSSERADCELQLFVRGNVALFNELRTESEDGTKTTPGEFIPINPWFNGIEGNINVDQLSDASYSQKELTDITFVQKPITKGFITLALFDRNTCEIEFLAKYNPDETKPSYHRYRIAGKGLDKFQTVTVLTKVKHVEMTHDTDMMLITNMTAMMLMLKAYREYEDGNFAEGKAKRMEAIDFLNSELSDTERVANELDFHVEEFLGCTPNLI